MRCMGFLLAARHSSQATSALARSVGCGDPLPISRGCGGRTRRFRAAGDGDCPRQSQPLQYPVACCGVVYSDSPDYISLWIMVFKFVELTLRRYYGHLWRTLSRGIRKRTGRGLWPFCPGVHRPEAFGIAPRSGRLAGSVPDNPPGTFSRSVLSPGSRPVLAGPGREGAGFANGLHGRVPNGNPA